ncbi:MAG: plasmid replication protein [Alphaproteobacteria bacterium]|nr:plasmid replication protein [Alphaproteobacteria bacterium]
MAALPHRDPGKVTVWHRQNGRFHLIVQAGHFIDEGQLVQPGLPWGNKARLILLHINKEGQKSRHVPLGASMRQYLLRLGLSPSGGKNGTITGVRDQMRRISRARLTMQWNMGDENQEAWLHDQNLIDGVQLWTAAEGERSQWPEEVVLTEQFHRHLQEHGVPLAEFAIAHLRQSSLALDLYVWLAHRVPRLKVKALVTWGQIELQVGSKDAIPTKELARRVRDAMPDLLAVYDGLRIDVRRDGLVIHPGPPAVPRTRVVVPSSLTTHVRGARPLALPTSD